MKKSTTIALLSISALLLLGLSSCFNPGMNKRTRGSGNVITKSPSITGSFDALWIGNAVNVDLKQGPFSIRVEGDDNIVDMLITKVENGTLKIDLPRGSYSDYKLKISLSCPALRRISLDAASSLSTGSWTAEALDIKLDAACQFTADSLTVRLLDLSLDAASSAAINGGSADNAHIDLDAASSLDAHKFLVNTASLSADAASSAKVNVLAFDELKAEAASGIICYMRENKKPTIKKQKIEFSSSIKFRNAE